MLILGMYTGGHDANAVLFDDYRLLAAVQQERVTRVKGDGGRIPTEAIEECLNIAGSTAGDVDVVMLGRSEYPERYLSSLSLTRQIKMKVREFVGAEERCRSLETELVRRKSTHTEQHFNSKEFLTNLGCGAHTVLRFYNHHEAHAIPCLFHSNHDGLECGVKMLLHTADGRGDNVQYSHRVFGDMKLETLYGDDSALLSARRVDSIGIAYQIATKVLGFKPLRHEGKVTGLAAFGKARLASELQSLFHVDNSGQITTRFSSYRDMKRTLVSLFSGCKREDVAASIQRLLEETVLQSVTRLLERTCATRLGLSGGVHANVKLNQRLAEDLPVDDVFVYPAMSDAGLAAGGALRYLLDRDGMDTWLSNGWPLEHLYFGRSYGSLIDSVLDRNGATKVKGDPVQNTARELADGKVVGIFTKGMEYGPRALGARSILASPVDATINDSLNRRLARSEFMPFAPVVSERDAPLIFEVNSTTQNAMRFMTVTCAVRERWKSRIPAVVHVDGTARPQIITREHNPLYFDVLQAYKSVTKIPVLVNTSFNVHEEPIVNSPAECAQALLDGRVDGVVTDNGYYTVHE